MNEKGVFYLHAANSMKAKLKRSASARDLTHERVSHMTAKLVQSPQSPAASMTMA